MKKNEKRNNRKKMILVLVPVLVFLAAFLFFAMNNKENQEEKNKDTIPPIISEPIQLDYELEISEIGSYEGIYMEDGSDEAVQDVMVIVLKNNSEKDLQYAEIYLPYEAYTAAFEVSNLKAGASVVLLEQNRQAAIREVPASVQLEHVVFFEGNMEVLEDVFEISGMDGVLNIKNISSEAVNGDIYVYYKNCQDDLYFGGITYRVLVRGGLAAEEIKQITTSHYAPEKCEVVMVDVIDSAE